MVPQEGKPGYEAARAGASEVAKELLQMIVDLQDPDDEKKADEELLCCLLTLHALCVADVMLCIRKNDPANLVRSLVPYLRVSIVERRLLPAWRLHSGVGS